MASKPQPVIEYCRQLARLFGLAHWRIDLDPVVADDDALASIRVVSGQQRALLQLGRTYASLSPEDQRSTILHELTHIWLWPCGESLEGVGPLIGTAASAVLCASHDLAVERATDAIACAVAPHFPLPGGN